MWLHQSLFFGKILVWFSDCVKTLHANINAKDKQLYSITFFLFYDTLWIESGEYENQLCKKGASSVCSPESNITYHNTIVLSLKNQAKERAWRWLRRHHYHNRGFVDDWRAWWINALPRDDWEMYHLHFYS